MPEDKVFVAYDGGSMMEGSVATDGSLKNGFFAALRAGGWAAGCMDERGSKKAIYGAVPFPAPTILLCELWAVYMALRHGGLLTALVLDNATVLRGLLRGKVYCCAANRPFAHVWKRIWGLLEDMDLLPGENLLVFKIKSHLTEEQIRGLPAEQQQHAWLNKLADEWVLRSACPRSGG